MGSASAIGLAHEIGSLHPGKRADFLVIDPRGSASDDIHRRIIESGDLQEVYISGKSLL